MKTDEKWGLFPVLKGRIQEANCCHPSVLLSASRVCFVIIVLAPLIPAIMHANRRILTAEVKGKMLARAGTPWSFSCLVYRGFSFKETLFSALVQNKCQKKSSGDLWGVKKKKKILRISNRGYRLFGNVCCEAVCALRATCMDTLHFIQNAVFNSEVLAKEKTVFNRLLNCICRLYFSFLAVFIPFF